MLKNRDTNTIFSMISKPKVPMSTFTQRFKSTMTMDENYLVPIRTFEIVPGDNLKLSIANFTRMLTLKTPIMDNMYMDIMAYFCPYRILWHKFKNMMGEQNNPNDSIDYSVPTVTAPASGFGVHSLADYFNINPYVGGIEVSSLYFRAYNKIFNEWYRDENLVDMVPDTYELDSDNIDNYHLLKRGKRKDYFTSALPFPQKGVAVELPLGTTAPVVTSATGHATSNTLTWDKDGSGTPFTPNNGGFVGITESGSTYFRGGHLNSEGSVFSGLRPNNLEVDLSEATASTITALRQAIALQVFYERCARGGSRYTELIQEFFGVRNPDARLQRPEFLGGTTLTLNVNTVAQTSATSPVSQTQISPQANLSAFATFGQGSEYLFNKSFTEYGCVMIIANIRADLTYQQGVPRFFKMLTRLDFYNPTFAHLSEQTVLNSEIMCTGDKTHDDGVFGYQERDAQYRHHENYICGKLRSQDPQSLDYWHLAQELPENVALNSDFITEDVPVERAVAVKNEPHFMADFQFTTEFTRPMPMYGTPMTFGI